MPNTTVDDKVSLLVSEVRSSTPYIRNTCSHSRVFLSLSHHSGFITANSLRPFSLNLFVIGPPSGRDDKGS